MEVAGCARSAWRRFRGADKLGTTPPPRPMNDHEDVLNSHISALTLTSINVEPGQSCNASNALGSFSAEFSFFEGFLKMLED